MAVLPLRFIPDPILRRQTKKLSRIPPNINQFTEDMIETMHAEQGVGLAANQIGSLQKVAVIQLPEWDQAIIMINPEIIKREGEREVEEGCLSLPGYRGMVKRSLRVRVRYLGLDGKLKRIKAEGLLAQALEHETDHLNGIVYIDRLVSRESIWKITYQPSEDNPEKVDASAGSEDPPAAEPSDKSE